MATHFAVGTWLSFLDDEKQMQLYSEFKAATGKSVRDQRPGIHRLRGRHGGQRQSESHLGSRAASVRRCC